MFKLVKLEKALLMSVKLETKWVFNRAELYYKYCLQKSRVTNVFSSVKMTVSCLIMLLISRGICYCIIRFLEFFYK